MGSALIRGKYVVTRVIDEHSSEIIEDGAVFQRDGEIMEIGKYDDLKNRYDADEEIGSSNHVVIPGLTNAHHHTGFTPFQLGISDLPLEPWLVARWSGRSVDNYLDTLYCAMQMIESGITTVMHNHPVWTVAPGEAFDEGSRILKAYKDSGMRVAFSYAYRDQNRLVYDDDESYLSVLPSKLAEDVAPRLKSTAMPNQEYFDLFDELFNAFGSNQPDQRIMHFLSPINIPRCSDDFMRATKEHASRYGTWIHIHLLETMYEKMYSLKRFGKSSLAHLNDLGFLGPELSCAHGVWVTEEDIELLVETGTCISHNASSNLRLKSGILPLNALLAKGATVAIGIDEAGINDDNDIFQEMRLVQKLHRVPGIDTPSPTSHQILKLATANGAYVTGFADRTGTLEVGKRADMVLLNMQRMVEPFLDPESNIVDTLLYRGLGVDVDTVIVDGEVLLRDKQFTKVNKEEVWAELKAKMSSPLQPYELERRQISRELYPHIEEYYKQWEFHGGTPYYQYNQIN